jgi:hypothetical protein
MMTVDAVAESGRLVLFSPRHLTVLSSATSISKLSVQANSKLGAKSLDESAKIVFVLRQ